jgi:hypothetical protein
MADKPVHCARRAISRNPSPAAEYIQATTRIGRDHNRPGLVVAVLNLHKPRDRTHFEQFGTFHRSFGA